jgi:hypothetical protein
LLKAQEHPKDPAYSVSKSSSWRFRTIGSKPGDDDAYLRHVCAEFSRSIREMGTVVERLWAKLPADRPKPHPDGLDEQTNTLWKNNKPTAVPPRVLPIVKAAFADDAVITRLQFDNLLRSSLRPGSRRNYKHVAESLLLDHGITIVLGKHNVEFMQVSAPSAE